MMKMKELVYILHGIQVDKLNRESLIKTFQSCLWNSNPNDLGITEHDFELLSGLAYDLDHFESDPKVRSEDDSFFGEEDLVNEIDFVLASISEGQRSD
jgi:hypothetical protein